MALKPVASYYYGRPAKKIHSGDENWQWAIELEGGVVIKNQDKKRTKAPSDAIIGVSLLREVDNALEFGYTQVTQDPPNVVVVESVSMTKNKWTISDSSMSTAKGESVQGDEEEEPSDTPPDPSPDRVASGPTTPPQTKKAKKRV